MGRRRPAISREPATKSKTWPIGHVLSLLPPEKTSTASPRNRRNHQHLVAFLKAVFVVPQEADIFLVDIEVDKAANLSIFSAQVLPKRRKAALDIGYKFRKIRRRARNLAHVVGVLLKCIG